VTAFYKLSGSGNDFLALAEPAAPPAPEQIRAWCRRGVSLGADGLFVLRRLAGGAGGVVMDYWNADGLPAALCLNGTRCAAQLAFHLGWAADRVRIETAAAAVDARRLDGSRVALALAAPPAPRRRTVVVGGEAWAGWSVEVGVPHFVLPWSESLAGAPVVELGRALRFAPDFAPAGVNVDFVRFPDAGTVEIRTYERGVEDETLSCGTGVLAAAAVGLALGRVRPPLAVHTQSGLTLDVEVDGPAPPDSASGRWSLGGDARLVAAGELLPEAELSPAPPAWS
jgi:diaminopimelate epimerase